MGPSGSGSIPCGLRYSKTHLETAVNKLGVSPSEDSWLRYKRARFLKKLCSFLIDTNVYHEETYLRVESVGLYFMQLYFVPKPQLAKDAQSMGDPVLVENYLQHADHYSRRLAELNERSKDNSINDKNNNSASLPIKDESKNSD